MKKIITTLTLTYCFLFLGSKQANAQIINPGFETWTTDVAVPTAMNPNSGNTTTGWWDYNVFNSSYVGSSPVSVFRCDTAHSGSYSAKIKTVIYTTTSWNIYKAWGVPFIGHDYYDTLGILYNGTVNEASASSSPGFPFTQQISQFSFWYQYYPNGVDTAECRVSIINSGTVIAGGLVKINAATGSTWTQANITMFYVNTTLMPDTMYVLFSSSSLDKKPQPGSILLVDDITTTALAGIEQIKDINSEVMVFPNPASTSFQVGFSGTLSASTINVYDVNGKLVLSQATNSKTNIDASNLNAGVYNISIITNEGVANKRLVIVR
jgi:type IX secretion system substrate protein